MDNKLVILVLFLQFQFNDRKNRLMQMMLEQLLLFHKLQMYNIIHFELNMEILIFEFYFIGIVINHKYLLLLMIFIKIKHMMLILFLFQDHHINLI